MGRKALKIHELRIVQKQKGAYVNYRGKSIYLRKWDLKKDAPTAEAVTRFEEFRAMWRADPLAGLLRGDDPLLIDIWADWRASPQGPRTRPEDTKRVECTLFGVEG